jgi:hypothetical protein
VAMWIQRRQLGGSAASAAAVVGRRQRQQRSGGSQLAGSGGSLAAGWRWHQWLLGGKRGCSGGSRCRCRHQAAAASSDISRHVTQQLAIAQTHPEGCWQEDRHGRNSLLTRMKAWEGDLLAEVQKISW